MRTINNIKIDRQIEKDKYLNKKVYKKFIDIFSFK